MKKIYLLLGIALLIASCNTKKSDAQGNAVVEEEIVGDVPMNALDVDGIYVGTLPTASGEGMVVEVTLSGNTYKKTVTYVGKSDEPIETVGEFVWDDVSGPIITFIGEEAPNKYIIGEDRLISLDMDGEIITGDLADMYVLKKK
jgi:uncharacterized lipoprotein NlpE involved in copper resistance